VLAVESDHAGNQVGVIAFTRNQQRDALGKQ
jgi:hypothetical protein